MSPRTLATRPSLLAVAAALFIAGGLAGTAGASPEPTPTIDEPDRVMVEAFTDDGRPFRVSVPDSPLGAATGDEARSDSPRNFQAADSAVTAIQTTGTTAARFDMVFLGDGYTAEEQDTFYRHVQSQFAELMEVEPYKSYEGLFNVWAVEVVSAESGVSGDPTADVERDTALGSYYWCAQTERLLCTDTDAAAAYAAQAPAADGVIVLANSTKYGGAGYPSLSTASGGNVLASQILAHELGHSIGGLADEYFYPGYPPYALWTGDEPKEPNISTLTAAQMAATEDKWHLWLGEESPDGGIVDTYEGGGYYERGLNRPTVASLMRVLGKPFNLVSSEAMVGGFYERADLLTSELSPDTVLRAGDKVTVDVPQLTGHSVGLRWYLSGRELTELRGADVVSVDQLGVPLDTQKRYKLTVRAVDGTAFVRDRQIRNTLMRDDLSWTVQPTAPTSS